MKHKQKITPQGEMRPEFDNTVPTIGYRSLRRDCKAGHCRWFGKESSGQQNYTCQLSGPQIQPHDTVEACDRIICFMDLVSARPSALKAKLSTLESVVSTSAKTCRRHPGTARPFHSFQKLAGCSWILASGATMR